MTDKMQGADLEMRPLLSVEFLCGTGSRRTLRVANALDALQIMIDHSCKLQPSSSESE